ncbi:MAG: SPOR domain-containing protein [Thermodesulfobacteriota bacterium]
MKALLLLFAVLCAASAQAQDWQIRSICDMRKGGGAAGRKAECAQLAADVVMLLPEKAGPGNVAVLAELSDNLEKAGVRWDAPCKDPSHCPDAAYAIRYAFVPTKAITIPRDRMFTALVCREGFSETAPDDAACRMKLLKVLQEMTVRARKEGSLLAIIRCGGQEAEAIRPDGQGVAGYELVYAFVRMPDTLPMAGGDPKASATYAVDQIAEPQAPPQPSKPASAAQAGQTASPAPAKASPAGLPSVNSGEIVMQVAALPTLTQAETVADRLSAKGIESSFERAEVNGREFYRVLAKGTGNPDAFRQKLAEMGYPGAIQKR